MKERTLPYRECNQWKQRRSSQKLICKEENKKLTLLRHYSEIKLYESYFCHANYAQIQLHQGSQQVNHHKNINWICLIYKQFNVFLQLLKKWKSCLNAFKVKLLKTESSLVLLPSMLHYVSRSCEDLDRSPLGDFTLSHHLLDGQNDLLAVFDSQLHRMAKVLLQHILSWCLNHHWQTVTIKKVVYDAIERIVNNLRHWADNCRC